MQCHICGAEAVARCYHCGQLMCDAHGRDNCTRCDSAIAAGDPRPDRITALPTTTAEKPAWWRPQPAEQFEPPACYACKGLTRALCSNCGAHYCSEHAGPTGLCRACSGSLWLGPAVLAAIVFLVLLILVLG
jgi:hypothetical protein